MTEVKKEARTKSEETRLKFGQSEIKYKNKTLPAFQMLAGFLMLSPQQFLSILNRIKNKSCGGIGSS